jgi:hypothetical protein
VWVEHSDRLLEAMTDLQSVSDDMTPEEAVRSFDETSLQVFWREWPHVSAWAGRMWRRLNEDLEGPGTPVADHELDEVGGEGGG